MSVLSEGKSGIDSGFGGSNYLHLKFIPLGTRSYGRAVPYLWLIGEGYPDGNTWTGNTDMVMQVAAPSRITNLPSVRIMTTK